MDNAGHPDDTTPTDRPDTAAEKRDRLAWEAERIAEAPASAEAGLLVDAAEVDAWMDSLGTEHELPVPYPRR
jgi:predicted transcriptional regulator